MDKNASKQFTGMKEHQQKMRNREGDKATHVERT